jgi:hypothetical protein
MPFASGRHGPRVREAPRIDLVIKECIMSRYSIRKSVCLALPLAAAMIAAPVAHASDRMGRSDAQSQAQSAASNSGKVVSGGVGIAARDALRQRAEDYELKLVFAQTPSGEYVAEVPVTITDRRGNTVIDAVSDGPWMYVDLPSGNYSVKAQYNGRTETRQVSVTSGSQRTVYVRFPDGGNGADGSMNVSSAR